MWVRRWVILEVRSATMALDHGLGLLDVDLVALEGDGDLLVVFVVDVVVGGGGVGGVVVCAGVARRDGDLDAGVSVMALRFFPLVPMTKARREAGIMMWVETCFARRTVISRFALLMAASSAALRTKVVVPVLRVVEASILTPRYLFCTLDMTVESLVTESCESESEKDCWAMARWMTGAEPAQVETGAAPFAPH